MQCYNVTMEHCDIRMSTVLLQLNISLAQWGLCATQHWICIMEYSDDTMQHCDSKADYSYVNIRQWHPNAAKCWHNGAL